MGFYKKENDKCEPEELCPICQKVPPYKKTRIKKTGYFDGHKFITTGTEKVIDEWWACKKCTKNTPTKKYNKIMIDDYNNKEIIKAKEQFK